MGKPNKIRDLLLQLDISTEASIESFYPRVRDRDDVSVLKCKNSGVLFLSRTDHIGDTHYQNHESFSYWSTEERAQALSSVAMDDDRRARQFSDVIRGKKWLDVGTGLGGILDRLKSIASRAAAVEPQPTARKALLDAGYSVYSSIFEIPESDLEVVSLFHVLEHLTEPVEVLKELRGKMAQGAKLIVEVPHAADFLISFLECEAFKKHTFWSEHLILHTQTSLKKFLHAAGFQDVVVSGFQRYSLANHLHWLAKGKPGGHTQWATVDSDELNRSYTETLSRLEGCDTLIATAINRE